MTRQPYPSEISDRFLVRMPNGLRPWIADEARRNQRSMNAQVVWMLQRMVERLREEAAKPIS